MLLKRVVIRNYRSCLRTSLDLHKNLSVLIGPNGSGKTNILQGLMLLNKMTDQQAIGHPHRDAITVSSQIEAHFQENRADVRLNASVAAITDEFNRDVIRGSVQRWSIQEPRKKRDSFEYPIAVAASAFGMQAQQYIFHLEHPLLHQVARRPETLAILGQVARYCHQMRYYGASQFTNPASCPASFEVEQEEKRRSFFRQRGHARILYDMYLAKKAEPNHAYMQFIDMVGPKGLRLIDELSFRVIRTSSTDYSVRVGGRLEKRRRNKLLVIPQFRIGKQKLSPNQLSEGTFKTLALIFHVITELGSALLIEEPEVCVHHGLLSSILEIIKRASRRKQIILSTHSDYVLDHVAPENVYRVSFEKVQGTIVRHIPTAMKSKELSALKDYLERQGNLGEYWREGGLGDLL